MGPLPLILFPLITKSHRFRIKLLLDHLLRDILITKIHNPFFRHLKVMGYPLLTRSQNTTTSTTTTTTTCQQSKLLTAMAFPKGTLSQRRKLSQPQQVKRHDHNVYIILINTEIRKFCQQNSDEGLLQVMESLLKIQ